METARATKGHTTYAPLIRMAGRTALVAIPAATTGPCCAMASDLIVGQHPYSIRPLVSPVTISSVQKVLFVRIVLRKYFPEGVN